MKKKENLLWLLLLGVGGYALYRFKGKKSPVNEKGNDATDWSQTPNAFDPVAYAKKHPEFKKIVTELQERLNVVLAELGKSTIKVDGYLGQQSEWALGQVFGTETLPVLYPKQIVQYNTYLYNRDPNESVDFTLQK